MPNNSKAIYTDSPIKNETLFYHYKNFKTADDFCKARTIFVEKQDYVCNHRIPTLFSELLSYFYLKNRMVCIIIES